MDSEPDRSIVGAPQPGCAGHARGRADSGASAQTQADPEIARLVVAARDGDPDAFGALVERHYQAARRVALAALVNAGDADEAVQEACLTAWRRIRTLDDPAAFRSWLLRITWHKSLDRRRSLAGWLRRWRAPGWPDDSDLLAAVPGSGADPATALMDRERDEIVARTIRSLPSRLRDPFLLAASGEHRYEEIAALLAIPVGTVKWRMSEARRVLKEKLTRLGFGDGS